MASSINSDNGVVSGSSGLKSTADTSGVLALQSNGSTGVTLDTSLNVGIGRSPVTYGSFKVLDVAGASGAIQKWVHTGSTVELQAYASSSLTGVGSATNHPLLFVTNDTERFRVGTAGQLGIGGANYGTSGQVLTSAGSGAAPSWTTISGSSQWVTSGSDIYYNTGNVGIGTTTFTSISGTVKTLSLGGTNTSTSGGIAYQVNGTVKGYHYVDADELTHQSASGGHKFLAVNAEKARINTYGLGLGGAVPSSGMGITFPATQSASSDANTLDDYEEGTWTPVLTRTGSSYTFSGQGGVYTKIGNVVTVQFSCDISAIGTQGTGYNSISGFPFAPNVYAGAGRSTATLSVNSVLTSATALYYAAAWFFTDGTNALQTNFTAGNFSGSITYTV